MCTANAYHSGRRGHRHHHGCGHRHRHGHPFLKFMTKKFGEFIGQPPVNVEEKDDRYEIHVYAAGYSKSDFEIKLKDNNLIVKAKKQRSNEQDSIHWKRQEFYARGFERWFELNEKIDKAAIKAAYKDGVLTVTLPKLEGMETKQQDIDIE